MATINSKMRFTTETVRGPISRWALVPVRAFVSAKARANAQRLVRSLSQNHDWTGNGYLTSQCNGFLRPISDCLKFWAIWTLVVGVAFGFRQAAAQPVDGHAWHQVRAAEEQQIQVIESVFGSVVAIYDWDRQGGGSGVVIDPSGIAVTNHHVIMGAGVRGLGGLADGKLYEWDLIGSDPGGDVAVIQLRGRDDFPHAKFGDSDTVRVGDWAMAMGNPFVLSEDYAPTVTLGIVSGIQRFQPGAGQNQLVYGNCIQIDSSINPGNSGGPLFNRHGQIIGINGRGSFLDRGRVNVGLGYAISSNQVVNFLPDLLATKLARHGTLDASFGLYGGRIRCTTINEDAPVARAGLSLGDELLEFEGVPITSSNQYLNLICTLPEGWPAVLRVRKSDGEEKTVVTRLLGLPYQRPQPPPRGDPPPGQPDQPPDERQRRQLELQQEMMALLAAEQGKVRKPDVNRHYVDWLWARLVDRQAGTADPGSAIRWSVEIWRKGDPVGVSESEVFSDGRWHTSWRIGEDHQAFEFDGENFFALVDGKNRPLTLTEAKLIPMVNLMIGVAVANVPNAWETLGNPLLDGSDKASGKPAYRIKLIDADRDWFYVWLHGLSPKSGDGRVVLCKVSPDQDGDRAAGAFLFKDWADCQGWLLPMRCYHVKTLLESEQLELRLRDWQVLSEGHSDERP
ncbi:MAG TPA: trypsin-like peptidase domain-containing protein [Pirellulaceae bacterium]|nr:trypsin-like peptidase domain-containing protein [Pirellulaceae bacterium]